MDTTGTNFKVQFRLFAHSLLLQQDGTFSVLDFCDAFLENEVQRVLRAYPDTISINIHCAQLGHWSALPDKNFTKLCKIRINPVDVLDMENEKLKAFAGTMKHINFLALSA